MKKLRIKLVLALLVITVLIREEIYRGMVHYENAGLRPRILLKNPALMAELDLWIVNQEKCGVNLSAKHLVRKTLQITSRELVPGGNEQDSNTNHILLNGQANRTGYSRLFGEVFHYLGKKCQKDHLVMHHHLKGTPKLHAWTIPFILEKEYDYNEVIDVERRIVYTINPLLFDRLGIGVVKVASME